MTRDEWKAWAMSLKPGDRVIVKGWHSLDIATVKMVTHSGRVSTDKGIFYQNKWSDYYTGYGKTYGDLAPATPELIAEAEKQKWEEIEEKYRESVIREAKSLAYKLRYGEIDMPYDMAEELIALVEKYKGGTSMKVYIAGKITGDSDYKRKFAHAKACLEAEGFVVLNPAELSEGMLTADYMRICMAMIDSSDVVAFHQDYTMSKGAQLELAYCQYVGKQTMYLDMMSFYKNAEVGNSV